MSGFGQEPKLGADTAGFGHDAGAESFGFGDEFPPEPLTVEVGDGKGGKLPPVDFSEEGGYSLWINYPWPSAGPFRVRFVNSLGEVFGGLGAYSNRPGHGENAYTNASKTRLLFALPPLPPGVYGLRVLTVAGAIVLDAPGVFNILPQNHPWPRLYALRSLWGRLWESGPRGIEREPLTPVQDAPLSGLLRSVARTLQGVDGSPVTRLIEDWPGSGPMVVESTLGFTLAGHIYADGHLFSYLAADKVNHELTGITDKLGSFFGALPAGTAVKYASDLVRNKYLFDAAALSPPPLPEVSYAPLVITMGAPNSASSQVSTYTENFYIALDQPDQYLRTMGAALAGFNGGPLTIILKVRNSSPELETSGTGIVCASSPIGAFGQLIYSNLSNNADPTTVTSAIYRGIGTEGGSGYIWSPGGGVAAGTRVYALCVDRVANTYSGGESLAGAATAFQNTTAFIGGGSTYDAADYFVGVSPHSWTASSVEFIWGGVATVPVTIANLQAWSGGVVDPRITLGVDNLPLFYRADSFGGGECPNEGSGDLAAVLHAFSCTIADKLAL